MAVKKLMKGDNLWDSETQTFVKEIKYPCYISPKIDGIRAGAQEGGCYAYSGNPTTNNYARNFLSDFMFDGLDFEFTVGEPFAPDVYTKTYSAIQTIEGEPEFQCNIIDDFSIGNCNFEDRYEVLKQRVVDLNEYCSEVLGITREVFVLIEQILVHNEDELLAAELKFLNMGYEGAMTRQPAAKYKHGRCSAIHQGLNKLKRFSHTEGTIVDGYEENENLNDEDLDAYGRTKRSSHKENMVGVGRLGGYICTSPAYPGVTFRVSATSMKHAERLEKWGTLAEDIGELIRFKHLKHGEKDRPRHPLYAGKRHASDL